MPSLFNTARAYGLGMRALHGSIALLIVAQLLLGFLGEDLEPGESRLALWHATLGFLTLALVLVRVAWRVLDTPPDPVGSPGSFERRAASTAHALLYVLMLGLPLTGWLLASSEVDRIPLLGGFEVPALASTAADLVPPAQADEEEDEEGAADERGEGVWEEVHETLAWLAVALVALHALASLKHRIARDGVFERMF